MESVVLSVWVVRLPIIFSVFSFFLTDEFFFGFASMTNKFHFTYEYSFVEIFAGPRFPFFILYEQLLQTDRLNLADLDSLRTPPSSGG